MNVTAEPANATQRCATCGATLRLRNGMCLNCVFGDAARSEVSGVDRETFTKLIGLANNGRLKQRFPGHDVLGEVGRGGMGIIFRARENESGRVVALKCALAESSYHLLARFRREAATASRLDHPNVVPVYSVGESQEGLPFFTMKFAAGGSLDRKQSEFQADPRKSVSLMVKIARAVHYAHEQGVLHRDIKPANILMDGRDEPLISDFGLARWSDAASNLTRSLATFGTVGYLSPEQAGGPAARLTASADVYSLGAVLFELLTGRTPFVGEHVWAVLRQAAERPAPKLRSIAPHLDRDLEIICARCLESQPTARYQSAAEFADDLEHWLSDRPIIARAPGIWDVTTKWIRRNRRLAATAGAALLIVGGLLLWQLNSWRTQSHMRANILATRSIAVMPFLNLDTVTSDTATADYLAATLQNELSTLGPARVMKGRSKGSLEDFSLDQMRKGAEATKARAILTGTVRGSGGSRRVAFRLLDSSSGESLLIHISTENRQGPGSVAIGPELTRPTYEILTSNNWAELILSEKDPGMSDRSAREIMLAGRDLSSRQTIPDLDRAIALFKKAITQAPDSSLAHSYLAFAAITRNHYIADPQYLSLGKAEAAEAIRLSPASSEAHKAIACAYSQQGQFRQALEQGLQAIELSGVEEKTARFLGTVLDRTGDVDLALKWLNLAKTLQRTPVSVEGLMGDCWVRLGEDERALRAYSRSMELQPTWTHGRIGACQLRMLQGDFEAARKLSRAEDGQNDLDGRAAAAQVEFFARDFRRAERLYRELVAGDRDGGGAFYGAMSYESAWGRSKQAIGDKEEAKEILTRCLSKEMAAIQNEPENAEAFYRLAAVESSLGEMDSSISHLHIAIKLGWRDYRSLAMDPRFDAARANDEFQRISNELSEKVATMRTRIVNQIPPEEPNR
jgi:serine/threonine protein kinase/tetratricopeptide (TPR) repeat protein